MPSTFPSAEFTPFLVHRPAAHARRYDSKNGEDGLARVMLTPSSLDRRVKHSQQIVGKLL